MTHTRLADFHVCVSVCAYNIIVRESSATFNSSSTGDDAVHIGFPLKEAVWRTNHGYDPVIRAHYEWSQSPSSWSMQRYMFIHEAFMSYQKAGVKIGETCSLPL